MSYRLGFIECNQCHKKGMYLKFFFDYTIRKCRYCKGEKI